MICQSSTDDTIERRVSTVGTVLPGIGVKIVDPETGRRSGRTSGALLPRLQCHEGYYNMPEVTPSVVDAEAGCTRAIWRPSKTAIAVSRAGARTRSSGAAKTFRPGNRRVLSHHARREGCAGGRRADERYGEVVGAFVIKKDDADITEEDVRDFAKGGSPGTRRRDMSSSSTSFP